MEIVRTYLKWLWVLGSTAWAIILCVLFVAIFGFTAFAVVFTITCVVACVFLAFPFARELIETWVKGLPDWWNERPWKT